MISALIDNLSPAWQDFFARHQLHAPLLDLEPKLQAEYASGIVYPPPAQLFRAFADCPFEALKVVLLGQDPYHGPNQAEGLAFSVPRGQKIPPSLRNILRELEADLHCFPSLHGQLETWAAQGVLLLNSSMSVRAGQAASHAKLGWIPFTDALLAALSIEKEALAFVLWGQFAQAKKALLAQNNHLILEAPHPSPLSAHRGFLGSRPFSQINHYLRKQALAPINWQL